MRLDHIVQAWLRSRSAPNTSLKEAQRLVRAGGFTVAGTTTHEPKQQVVPGAEAVHALAELAEGRGNANVRARVRAAFALGKFGAHAAPVIPALVKLIKGFDRAAMTALMERKRARLEQVHTHTEEAEEVEAAEIDVVRASAVEALKALGAPNSRNPPLSIY